MTGDPIAFAAARKKFDNAYIVGPAEDASFEVSEAFRASFGMRPATRSQVNGRRGQRVSDGAECVYRRCGSRGFPS